ncbi:MAG: MFS transporter, partial [Gorillibacterium sp.]|nr:MFS transporter [Gorillibacterium sp.]
VDRWSIKKVVIIAGIGRGTVVFTTGLLYFYGLLEPWHLFVFAVLSSSFEAFSSPAEMSLVPKVLPKALLLKGNSITSIASRIAEMIGLGAAGTIIAWFGTSTALWIDAATFFTAAIFMSFLSLRKNQQPASLEQTVPAIDSPSSESSTAAISESDIHINAKSDSKTDLAPSNRQLVRTYWNELKEGFSCIKQNTLILTAALLAAFVNFCLAPLEVLMTIYVKDSLHSGPTGLSILSIAMTVGMIGGGLITSKWGSIPRKSTLILGGILLVGVSCAMLSIPPLMVGVHGLISAAMLMFVIGNAITIASVPISSYLMEATPEGMLGRVGSLTNMLCLSAMPLGGAMAGAIAEGVSVATIYSLMGVLILLPTSLLFRYKSFRRI